MRDYRSRENGIYTGKNAIGLPLDKYQTQTINKQLQHKTSYFTLTCE